MRTTLIAVVTAAGIGLLGPSGASATPAAGTVLHDLAARTSNTLEAGYCRWWRRCWRDEGNRRWCRVWRRCWW